MLLQRQWHEQLSKGRFYQQPIPTAVVIMRWPDGATLQRLCTDADFRAEGESMGHCIGGQINRRTGRASGKSYYYQRSEQGQEASFSYRDPAGVPQATFTIQYTGNEDLPWSLEQIQGPSDDKVTDEDAAARVASVLEALYESTAGVDGMYVDDMLEMAGRKLLWAYEPAIRGLMRLSSVRDSIEARNNSKGDLIEIIGAWTSSDEVAGDLEHRPLAHQSVSDAVSALSHLDFQIKTKLHEIVPPIFGERMLRHEENGEPVIWTDVESYPYETTQQTPGWLRDILPTYTTTGIGWTVTGSDGRQYDLEASISSELRWVLSDRETGTVVRSANSFSTILDQLGIPGSYAEALSDLAERADRAIMPFEDDSLLTTTEEFREARDRRFIEGAP